MNSIKSNGIQRNPVKQATNTLKFTIRSWEQVFSRQVCPERRTKSASQCLPFDSVAVLIYGFPRDVKLAMDAIRYVESNGTEYFPRDFVRKVLDIPVLPEYSDVPMFCSSNLTVAQLAVVSCTVINCKPLCSCVRAVSYEAVFTSNGAVSLFPSPSM